MKRFEYLLPRESQECIGFYPGCAPESPGWDPGTWGSVFAAVHAGLRTSTLRNLSILWKLFLVSLSFHQKHLRNSRTCNLVHIYGITLVQINTWKGHILEGWGRGLFSWWKENIWNFPLMSLCFPDIFFRQYDMFRPCMKKLIMITLETRKREMGLSSPSTQR